MESIDIIIAAYNAQKTIDKTLCSIAIQKEINNFNVYVVNDFSKYDYSENIKTFKKYFSIKELKLNKNMGPGYARQYGIDHSNGEYIIFIDSDDMFASPLSFLTLLKTIKQKKADIVCADFLQESSNKNRYEKIENNDIVNLHGKIYRRKFIQKTGTRFPNLYGEEDNAFNNLLMLYNPKVEYIDEITYINCYNKNSITMKNDKEYIKHFEEYYTDAMLYAIEQGLEHNASIENIVYLAFTVLIVMYYRIYLNNNELLFKNEKIMNHTKDALKIYEENKDKISEEQKYEIFNNEYDYGSKILDTKHTFNEFINQIRN